LSIILILLFLFILVDSKFASLSHYQSLNLLRFLDSIQK
jgi:hypothetical protein